MGRSNTVTDLKSKTKATRFLTFRGVIFFITYMVLTYAFRGFVNEILIVPYLIFSGLMCLFLLMPSIYNKGRNNLESIYILFSAAKTSFRPYIDIETIEKGDENEEDEYEY